MPSENTKLIAQIMNELINRVNNNEYISPVEWVDAAAKINMCTDEVDNSIIMLEGAMAEKEVDLIEAGESAAKANILKRKAIDYTDYLKKQAFRDRITRFIQIAKKRSEVEKRY